MRPFEAVDDGGWIVGLKGAWDGWPGGGVLAGGKLDAANWPVDDRSGVRVCVPPMGRMVVRVSNVGERVEASGVY